MFTEKTSATRLTRAGKLFSLIMVLAMLMGALPGVALAAEPAQSCTANYTVKSGDTLSSIAANNNVNWQDIASANNLSSPYVLTIGQALCVPGAAATSTSSTGTSTTTATKGFTIATAGNRLVITVTKFSKKATYYVRANDGSRDNNNWLRLGRLRVDKNGNAEVSFQMPKGLRNTTEMAICLKNVRNDDVNCVKQINPYTTTTTKK
jgi:murein DD-endopeptidase MepM/ murein hydrolase activator NlpD